MSKRGPSANFGGDEDRYPGSHDSIAMADSDKPTMATAAQMARRKIAHGKTASRRSASPAVTTVPAGNPGAQFQVPTQSGFNFSFGNTSTSFGQQPQQNGSPSPFPFGSANQTQQSSTNVFGQPNANSFGTTSFNSTSTQPQQNGFTPSTTPIFGQAPQQQPPQQTTSSFQFGQTQTNGLTPTPSTSSIFKSFGEQNQTPAKSDVPTFKFGASQPETQAPKPANVFASFGQKPQENGTKPVFGSSQPQPPATPSTSNIFGSFNQTTQQNGDRSLFGTNMSKESFTPSAPAATSIFSNTSSKPLQPNGDKPLFSSQPAQETPKPPSGNVFSSFTSQPETNGDKTALVQQTPSASLFSGFGQNKQDTTEPHQNFSFTAKQQVNGGIVQPPAPTSKTPSFSISNTEQQTPKPTASTFGHMGNQLSGATPQQDTSMTTPDHTPQKPTNTPATSQKMLPAALDVPSTTDKPRSLFDRISKPDADQAQGAPSAAIFSATPQATPSENTPKPFFTPSVKPMFSQSTAAKPSNEPVAEPPKSAPAKPLFNHVPQPPQSDSQRLSNNIFQAARSMDVPKPVEARLESTTSEASSVPEQPPKNLTDKQKRQMRHLNTGLLKHLQASDLARDWSIVFRYYFEQVYTINFPGKTKPPDGNSAASTSSAAQPSVSKNTATPAVTASGPSHPTPSVQTPQPPAASSNMLSNPPQTAPLQKKKRLFEDDDDATDQPPATDKRTRTREPMHYPKLPDTASNTAKLFEATLDKVTAADVAPPIPNSGFKPSTTFATSASTANSGFKPSLGSTSTSSASTNGGSMFAAFGKAAKAQEEKDRSKRKAEDYDSDDETAEEWEKRDREEQEAKRAKIAEAAKNSKGFVFGGAAAAQSPANNDTSSVQTPKAQPKSLFDRITPASPPKTAPSKPSLFSTQTPSESRTSTTQAPATTAHSSTSNIFGHLQPKSGQTTSNIFGFLSEKGDASQLGETVEKVQGTGDKTFKPDTPIKFGNSVLSSSTSAAAPPSAAKSNGLFGSFGSSTGQTNGGTPSGKLAPSSLGFNLGVKSGVLAASRATTPGVTTDGEGSTATGADEAEGEEQNEPQAEDKTALQPDELASNDVLFELGAGKKALCKKYEDNKSDVKEWVGKGKGPLYILKSKQTGKVRLMLKIAPYGKLAMNYEPLKGIEYKVLPGAGKTVSGAFFDHLHVKEPKIGQFTIQVKEAEDAKEIARVLNEAAST